MGCSVLYNDSTIRSQETIDRNFEPKKTIINQLIPNLIIDSIKELDLKGKLKSNSDFISFCHYNLPNLEILNLSSNNLTDISELKELKAPKLRILYLIGNKITNFEVFKDLDFPLKELYLESNINNQIGIFNNAKNLKYLRQLTLSIIENDNNGPLIKKFNEHYLKCDSKNTEIEKNIKECILLNIGQEGFVAFCNLQLLNIECLFLSNNNISNINFLEKFIAPHLLELDLSYLKKFHIL